MFKTKTIKNFVRKTFAVYLAISLVFSNFLPLIPSLIPVAQAQTEVTSTTISGEANADYTIIYGDENGLDAATGQLNQNGEAETFFGSCSGSDCIADDVKRGVLVVSSNSQYTISHISIDNGSITIVGSETRDSADMTNADEAWIISGEVALTNQNETVDWQSNGDGSLTIETVQLNTTYQFPGNENVTVTFTQLPEPAGSLTIRELTLSEEEVAALGALSSTAYDITSNMENGTFEYTLTLPNPSDDTSQIKYSEDGSSYEQIVGEEYANGQITITGLDHFTVFIISSPPPAAANIIDNGDAGFSVNDAGAWGIQATNGFQNDHHYRSTNDVADHWARWTFSDAELPEENVSYDISVTWVANSNRSSAVTYSLYDESDTKIADLATVDQTKDATGASVANGTFSDWLDVGTYTLNNGYYVEIRTNGLNDGAYAADAVQIKTAEAPEIVYVDDDWIGTGTGTDLGSDRVFGYNAFETIQDAIDSVADNGTVEVLDGDYAENITIDSPMTVQSTNGYATTSINGSGGNTIIVTADEVTIEGFTITNSVGTHGISASDVNDLRIADNNFTNIKSSASEVHAIAVYSGSVDVSGITIEDNLFSDIGYFGSLASGKSASAISIGWSTGTQEIDDVRILNNTISNIRSTGTSYVWPESKGAYGVLVNNGSSGSGGTTPNLIVSGNNISDLEGLWVHAIGLEGETPDASIVYNTVSDVTDHKSPSDGIGVFFEANTSADTVDVSYNSFATTIPVGVALHSSLTGVTVNADKNWWGDASGPSGEGPGTGTAVGTDVVFCPWLTTSDVNNPTYAGDCLSQIGGRTFIDKGENGLLLSADGDYPGGMKDDFTVRLYDDSWTQLEEQTTRVTANVGQYSFTDLFNQNTTYRICGVLEDGYVESSPSLGQTPVTVAGAAISGFANASIVANGSVASDEFDRCWETTLNEDDGAYLGVGYRIAPTTLVSPADDAVVNGNPTLSWNAVSSADHYEYESYSDAGLTSLIYATDVSGTSRVVGGSQSLELWWRIRVVDADGNVSDWSDAWKLTVDNTDPTNPGTPSATPTSPTNQTTQTWSWGGATDALSGLAGYWYRVWDGSTNVVASTFTTLTSVTTNLTEGIYTFFVSAEDNAGNIGGEVAGASYEVDTTAPVAPTNLSPVDRFATPGVAFTQSWDAVSDAVLYEYESCGVDPSDDGVSACSDVKFTNTYTGTTKNVGAGQPNSHFWWRVRAQDAAGNWSDWSVSQELIIDSDDPSVSLDAIASIYTNDDTPTLTGTATDSYDAGIANVEYRIEKTSDSSVVVDWTSATPSDGDFDNETTEDFSITPSSLSDDSYRILARSTDAAGNVSATDQIDELIVDTTDPTVVINSPSDNDFVRGTITVEAEVTDTNLEFYRFIVKDSSNANVTHSGQIFNDGPTVAPTYDWDTTTVADGDYSIVFRGKDKAGNINNFRIDLVVDNTNPVDPTPTSTSHTVSTWSNDNTVDVTWSGASDATSGVDGFYTEWNTSPTTMTGPVTKEYEETDSTETSPTLADGDEHYFHIATVDNAGNWTSTEHLGPFFIDTVDPTSTITAPTNTGDNSVVFTNSWDGVIAGTASDTTGASDIAQVDISISRASDSLYWDGANWISGTEATTRVTATGTTSWTYTVTDAEEDIYTIITHAVDNAGNVEDSYNITLVFDKTIPEILLTIDPSDPDANSNWYETQPTITLTATDNNDPIYGTEQIEYQWGSTTGTWTTTTDGSISFNPPGEGSFVLYYRALDKSGNYSDIGIKNVRYDATDLTEGPQNFNISPNPTSEDETTATWEAAEDNVGITRYELKWELDGSSTSYSKSYGGDVREGTIDNLTPGTWTVRLTAFDGADNSESVTKELIVDGTAPDAPTLSLAGIGVGSATLSWNDVEDGDDYIIYYGTESGNYLYAARVGDVTSYTVQGLGAGDYYFVVRAVDNVNNQSSNSNEVNTGEIVGAPGVAPGTVAQDFAPAGEVQGANTEVDENGNVISNSLDNGEVLGASDEVNWFIYNLPWLLLILQLAGLVFVELLINPKNNVVKLTLGVIATGAVLAIHFIFSDPSLYTDTSWVGFISQWFTAIALGMFAGIKALFFVLG